MEEEQDLVYRDASLGDRAGGGLATIPSSDETAAWERRIDPSETLLFRYSALTFNSHRIHYDRRYAVEVEGYAGLVVHGPLIATLLLGSIEDERPAASVERFSFRAIRLTFDTSDFVIRGRPGTTDGHFILWSMNNRGERAVEAEAWTR